MEEVDLHLIPIILALFLLGLLTAMVSYYWFVIAILVFPQGRILTRVFVDYPAFGRSGVNYLIANECVVILSAGAFWLLSID